MILKSNSITIFLTKGPITTFMVFALNVRTIFFNHKSLPTNWTILTDLNRIYFDTLIRSFHLYKLNVFQRICSRYTTNNLLRKTISINCDNFCILILIIIDQIKKETSCSQNELKWNNSLKNVHLTNATWRTCMYRFCSIYKLSLSISALFTRPVWERLTLNLKLFYDECNWMCNEILHFTEFFF